MKRKKNKKRRRIQGRPSATFPAKFTVGSRVRVKPGITDPDFKDIPLGGWAGTTSQVDQRSNPPILLIEWNQFTLDHMHPVYRNHCERDGRFLECLWLSETDVEPDSGESILIEQPTHLVSRPLSEDDPEDRIRAIFSLTSDDPLPPANLENLRRYARYLKTHLSFPLQAESLDETSLSRQSKYEIRVLGLLDTDDCDEENGVWCEVEQHGESFELPLAELEVRNNRHHRQLVEDYSFWSYNWSVEEEANSSMTHSIWFDTSTDQFGRVSSLKFLATCGLAGAVYGIVLGALLGAVAGTQAGMWVGAAVLGVLGLAIGIKSGPVMGAVNRMQYALVVWGIFSTIAGMLVGAMIGALVVAFTGCLIGGIVGALVGKVLEKWKVKRAGPFRGSVLGAVVGAVGLACYRDYENAVLWSVHGAWVGALSAVFLVLAMSGLIALSTRRS
jgi:hypothetical protein